MTSSLNLASVFTDAITEHLAIISRLDAQQECFERAAIRMTDCLLQGHKILWCGNGGSAADAQHLAAELVGRFRHCRRALPSIALTADTSVLTAIANDCGFADVFDRQLEALCAPGDVVVGISTSGKSRNVCAALERARALGAFTIAMTGQTGGRLAASADVCLCVPSSDTARIQEGHILLGHILCEWVELATCINDAVAVATPGGAE
jgi:D-sedoheptulose 7-phosphate isomerase